MTKKEILKMRDAVSITVENLISVTADIKKELIIIYYIGIDKEVYLPVAELLLRKNSCRDFIGYLKEKLGE